MNTSFLSQEEINEIGFMRVGNPVYLSRKASYYGASNISIGDNVRIDDFCILSGKITIGDYIHIAAYSALYGGEAGIQINDFSNLSSRITVYAVSDDYSGETMTNPMIPAQFKKVEEKTVLINRHCIIGSGSIILPGVTLGEGCSVGALSLIKSDLPEWTICTGIPAKIIKQRKNDLLQVEQEFLRTLTK